LLDRGPNMGRSAQTDVGRDFELKAGNTRKRRAILRILGLSMLFSGAALITHIVMGVSLRAGLTVAAMFPVATFAIAFRTMAPAVRVKVLGDVKIGLLAGLIATVAYDYTKFVLAKLDPSPYNPFEVIRIFGTLIAGRSASSLLIYTAGTAFHLLNGICFGVAYWLLLGRFRLWAAVVWGLFLEMFQLTLYPGWLHIRAYAEFAQISALSHLCYGTVLGLSCRWLYKRLV